MGLEHASNDVGTLLEVELSACLFCRSHREDPRRPGRFGKTCLGNVGEDAAQPMSFMPWLVDCLLKDLSAELDDKDLKRESQAAALVHQGRVYEATSPSVQSTTHT